MPDVSRIRPFEPVRVDRDRLETLVADYGPQGAERLIGRTLEDIAVRLNRADRAWRNDDHVSLCAGARELSDVASRVGLDGLSRTAGNVSQVAMTGDQAALASTVARMMRIGEASLMSAWDVDDLTL